MVNDWLKGVEDDNNLNSNYFLPIAENDQNENDLGSLFTNNKDLKINSAMTLEDSTVCLIPKEDFFELLYKNSDVSRKFIKLISNNLKEKENQLIKLAYNSVRKRVAEALSTLSNRYKTEGESEFTIHISREDLANLAGTATETTIRTLSDFKDEGLISIDKGSITILKIESLAGMRN